MNSPDQNPAQPAQPFVFTRAQVPWTPSTPEEDAALKNDIFLHGQRVPIVVDENGQVCDGWRRYQAVLALNVAPSIVRVQSGLDAIISGLVHRHMDPCERARFIAWVWSRRTEIVGLTGEAGRRNALMSQWAKEKLGWTHGWSPKTVERLFILAALGEDQVNIVRQTIPDKSVAATLTFVRSQQMLDLAAGVDALTEPAAAPLGNPTDPNPDPEVEPEAQRRASPAEEMADRKIVRIGNNLRGALAAMGTWGCSPSARATLEAVNEHVRNFLDRPEHPVPPTEGEE